MDIEDAGRTRPTATRLAGWMLALSGGLALATLLLAELGLRLLDYPSDATVRSSLPGDPLLMWELPRGAGVLFGQPNQVNSFGLRGQEPRTDAKERILTLGDSTVYGVNVPVDQTFTAVLGRAMGDPIEAVNGGIPGYSSVQSLRMLETRLAALPVRLLVIANLWSDNNFDSFIDADQLALLRSDGRNPRHLLRQWLRHFQLFLALEHHTSARRTDSGDVRTVGWGRLGQERLLGRRRVGLQDYRQNLRRLIALARAREAQSLLVVLGNEEDVRHDQRPWAWDPYRLTLREVGAEEGVPVLEVPPLLRQATGDPRAVFLDAMHPNADGHRVIGEALAATLKAADWPRSRQRSELPRRTPIPDPAGRVDPYALEGSVGRQECLETREWLGAQSPDVAGVARSSASVQGGITLRLYAAEEEQELLDSVWLPRSAPFALQAQGRTEVWIEAQIDGGGGAETLIRLKHQPLSVAECQAWRIGLDLDRRVVTREQFNTGISR